MKFTLALLSAALLAPGIQAKNVVDIAALAAANQAENDKRDDIPPEITLPGW